jgi:tetratricopeptide (TPR) repeat protein
VATEGTKKGWGKGLLIVLVLVALIVAGGAFIVLHRLKGRDVYYYRKGMLALDSGNTAGALENLRLALKKNPRFLEAQVEIVRTLVVRKDFTGAESELENATRIGLSGPQAAMLKANILANGATYRLESARGTLNVDLCNSVLKDQLDPAVELVRANADATDKPAGTYSQLGNLLMQKSRVYGSIWELHLKEAERLRATNGSVDDAKAQDSMAADTLDTMGRTQQEAMVAYGKAIEIDPSMTSARLAIATQELLAYVPTPERACKVLEPIFGKAPGHRQARLKMAEAKRLQKDYDGALQQLAQATPRGSEDYELMMARGRTLNDARRWEELAPLSADLVRLQPTDAWALFLRANALLNAPESDPDRRKAAVQEAANDLQLVFRKVKSWPLARLTLGRALDELGNQQQARSAYRSCLDDITASKARTLQQAREVLEVSYSAHMALYEALKTEDPRAAADQAVDAFRSRPADKAGYEAALSMRKATGASPTELENIALAHVAAIRMNGDADGALAACNEALAGPARPEWGERLSLVRARLLRTKGSYVEAVQAYEEMRKRWPDDKKAALDLAALQERFGHTAEAQAIYEEQIKAAPDDLTAISRLLSSLARTGKMEEARALVAREQDKLGPEVSQSLLLGLSLQEGLIDQALSLARSMVERNPTRADSHALLGDLLYESGDYAAARASYDRALQLDQDCLTAYRRVLLDLEQGDFARAADLMSQGRTRFPNQVAMALQLSVAQQGAGNPAEAVTTLQSAMAKANLPAASASALHLTLAVVYAGMGDAASTDDQNKMVLPTDMAPFPDRQDLLDHIAALQEPTRSKAAVALNLLGVFSRNGRPKAGGQQVDLLHQMLPQEPLPACVEAELLDASGKHQEAVEAYQAVIDAHPKFMVARLRLANSFIGAGDEDKAVKLLQESAVMANASEAAAIQFHLGRVEEARGNVEQAAESYKAAMAEKTVLPLAANNLAWMLATKCNDPAGALPYAQQAAEAAIGSAAIADTLGWVYYLNGDAEKAIPELEKARNGQQANPTVRYHLGAAYAKAGRKDEAKAELREALTISSDFPEAADATNLLNGL